MVDQIFYMTFPWPPSVNTYWRRCGNRYFISEKGKKYRQEVIDNCYEDRGFFDGKLRLSLHILAYPPDKRRRDLDNILKSLMDSLQHAGIYEDDSQIDEIFISRKPEILGKIIVNLKAF